MPHSTWLLFTLVCFTGCTTTHSISPQARSLGGLVIQCDPMDAKIFVDEQYFGEISTLNKQPLQLPVGPHRVEIRRDGFFSHFTEVTIGRGVRQKLAVKLRKEPY